MTLTARLPRAWLLGLLTVALVASVAIVPANSRAETPKAKDEEPRAMEPGIFATYSIAARRELFSQFGVELFSRYESKPAIALAQGESPDLRVPEKAWAVEWTGVIQVDRAGRYRFGAVHSGAVRLYVNERTVLNSNETSSAVEFGSEIELPVGISTITGAYQSTTETSLLRLYWESEVFRSS